MTTKTRHVLLYGDVDLRYTDGSAVWLVSMARTLASTNSRVSLLLKSSLGSNGLFHDLQSLHDVDIIDDFTTHFVRGPRYRPLMAAKRIDSLITERNIDVVVCRGFEICKEVAKLPNAGPRLWAYMTDIPQSANEISARDVDDLTAIASSALRIFAQTDEAREFLEYHIAPARGKTILLPPMLPNGIRSIRRSETTPALVRKKRCLQLVYAGKFARRWKTLEMCDLPRRATELGFDLELTMIGDKFQSDPDDQTWVNRMRKAITSSPGVTWLGGLSREATLHELARHDIGIAWRDAALDASHEISTKLLEYMACGVPPLLNRTAMHQQLLGDAYPLFVNDDEVLDTLRKAYNLIDYKHLREATRSAVEPYWISARAEALERALRKAEQNQTSLPNAYPLDIKLYTNDINGSIIANSLGAYPGITIRRNLGNQRIHPTEDVSMIVTDVASLAYSNHYDEVPVWLFWDKTAESTPRPANLNIAGILVTDPSIRNRAAWWAKIPFNHVFVIPIRPDDTANRQKTPSAQQTVAVIAGAQDWETVRKAQRLLSALRAQHELITLLLCFPSYDVSALTAWERENLLDSLEDFDSDPTTTGAWAIGTHIGSATWLREIGCVLHSDESVEAKLLISTLERSATPILCLSNDKTISELAEAIVGSLVSKSDAHASVESVESPRYNRVDSLKQKESANLNELSRLLTFLQPYNERINGR